MLRKFLTLILMCGPWLLFQPSVVCAGQQQHGPDTEPRHRSAPIAATVLGTFKGAITVPVAINNAGAVAGFFQASDGGGAFYWSRRTGFVQIPQASEAYDINNRGQIVGSMVIDDVWHGFLWNARTGEFQDFGPYIPTAINDRGQMVGWSYDLEHGQTVAWVYVDEQFRALFSTQPFDGTITDINERGVVAGTAYTEHGSRAFTWSRRQGFSFKQPKDDFAHSFAVGINSRGTVYGFSTMGGEDDFSYPSLWNPDGSVLAEWAAPGFWLMGHSTVNAQGWTVRSGNEIWMDQDSVIYLRAPAGLETPQVVGLNDRGQAVGMASSPEGVPHAVIWTVHRRIGTHGQPPQ